MPDAKRLIDMGCGTAILAAFACGPEGVVVAAGIGIAQFFFDAFYPDAQNPTQFAPVDKADLSTELDGLKSELTDAGWKQQLDQQTAAVLVQSSKFWDLYAEIQGLQLDGKTYVPLDDQTINDCTAYFNVGAPNALDVLRNARDLITMSSANDGSMTDLEVAEHYTKTTGLYCLIGSLMISYLKTAVIWRRAIVVLPYLQYQKYQENKKVWDAYPDGTKKAHPTWEPKNVKEPTEPLTAWEEWGKQDAAYSALIKEVGILVGYSEGTPAIPATAAEPGKPATKGLQVRMAENWKKTFDNITSRVQKVSVIPPPPAGAPDAPLPCFVTDSELNYTSKVSCRRELADLRMKVRCGALIAYEWENSMGEFALSGVIEDDITKYGKAIGLWKAAGASVQFSDYTVEDGDTLIGIAQAQYGDGNMYPKIFNFNRDILSDPNVIGTGQILKIPDKSVLSVIQ